MLILRILAFYLPIEEFVLKWLPVGDQTYLMMRQIPDLLVFVSAILLIILQTYKSRRLPMAGGWVDLYLLTFLLWAFFTVWFNSADVPLALANIKALVRYILIVYIVLIIEPTQRQIETIIRWLGYSIIIQFAIGIVQYGGGIQARDFFSARQVTTTVAGLKTGFTGDRFEGVNDLMGTLGNTINYATFLIIGLGLWVTSPKLSRLKYWSGALFVMIFIISSGSRSAVIAGTALMFGHQWIVDGGKAMLRQLGMVFPLMLVSLIFLIPYIATLDDAESFFFIFNDDYLEHAYNQRLGIALILGPQLLLNEHTLFGFSPDVYVFVDFVSKNLPMIPMVLLDELPFILEDVYWIALLVYYGGIGLILWCLFLFGMGKRIAYLRTHCRTPLTARLGTIALLLLIVAVPLNFLNQAFEVRQFSYYLWLLCGLALASYRSEKRNVVRVVAV